MRLIFNGLSIVTVLVIVTFWLYLLRTNKAGFHNFNIWLGLTVIVALAPILTGAFIYFMNHGTINLESVLGTGDLFIIAVAISSDGIGRLLPKLSEKNGKKSLKMYGIIFCILMIIFSSLLYSSSSNPENSAQKSERVFLVSSIFFLMTVILSGSCVVLSEASTQ